MADESQVTAPLKADETAPVAHPSDNVPVDVGDVAPLVVAKEVTAEPDAPAAPEPDKTPDAAAKPPKLAEWAEKKLAESAFEAREAKREAKRLADELAALKAPKPSAADDATVRVPAQAPAEKFGGYKTQAEFDAAVTAEATRRQAQATAAQHQKDFNTKADAAANKGKTDYGPQFDDAVSNLHQVGFLPYVDPGTGNVVNSEFLEQVLATDDPTKVLYELGSDPDRAAAILGMSPNARAVEIAKLSLGAPKKPTPLSNAPRPVVPVDGSARTSAEPSDADDDDTFFRKREAQLAARRA